MTNRMRDKSRLVTLILAAFLISLLPVFLTPASTEARVINKFTIEKSSGDTTIFVDPEDYSGGANEVIVLNSGKFLTAGSILDNVTYTSCGITAIRYNSDGTIDTTFGTDGRTVIVTGSGCDNGIAIIEQADGKIVIASGTKGPDNSGDDFTMIRLTAGGALDTSFGEGGMVKTDIGAILGGSTIDTVHDMAADSAGNIYLAGNALFGGMGSRTNFAVVKYDSNGVIDTSFGTGGVAQVDFDGDGTGYHYCTAATFDANGKLVLGGSAYVGPVFYTAFARLNTDGSLDTTFGDGGRFITDSIGTYATVTAITLQPVSHKIVAAGYYGESQISPFIVSLTDDGVLETTLRTRISEAADNWDWTSGMDCDASGNIYIVCPAKKANGEYTFGIAKVKSDLSALDTTFNTTGTALYRVGAVNGGDAAKGVAVNSAGKIVVAGWVQSTGERYDEALIRLNADGSPADLFTPEMSVEGNAIEIACGDTTPSADDHTYFGAVDLESGSVVRTFTIRNTGTAGLMLSGDPPVTISGDHAADFTVTTQPSSPVPAGSSTTFQVTFDPTGNGIRTAVISITNDDEDENPYTFTVRGSDTTPWLFHDGLEPQNWTLSGNGTLTISPESNPTDELTITYDYDGGYQVWHTWYFSATASATETLSLQWEYKPLHSWNNALARLHMFTDGPTGELKTLYDGYGNLEVAASGIEIVEVTAGKVFGFKVEAYHNDGSRITDGTLKVSKIIPNPEMIVKGNSVEIASGVTTPSVEDDTDFGTTAVAGGSITRTFTIQNTGSLDLILSGNPLVAISGDHAADFTVTTQPTSPVTTASSTTFQVTFNPTAAGLRKATVSIANNDIDENPYTFAIQGTGTAVLTVSGVSVSDKDYDGNTTANADFSGAALVGVNPDHDMRLGTAGASAAFSSKTVGENKTVTINGLTLEGADAGFYTLTQPTATASITPKELTVTATGISKTYDGNTSATVTLSDDRVAGDVLTASYTSAAFEDKHVDTGKTVNVSGISISGDDAGNYTCNTTATTTADITPLGITVTAVTDTKEYDGDNTSDGVPTITSGSLIDGDTATWTQTFDTKNAGTGKTLTPDGTVTDGNDGNNYDVNFVPVNTGVITQKTLTVTATGISKTYGGNTSATVTLSDDRVAGDVFTTSYASASFTDKNVGTGITVNVSGISISGTDAGNYILSNNSASTTANITRLAITVTAVTDTKEYDGDNTSDGSPTITTGSLADGDSVVWTQTFNNKNAGTGKTLTPDGTVTDGNDGNNYDVNFVPVSTGVITHKSLTVTGITAEDKVYDGNTGAQIDVTQAQLSGVITDDNVTLDTPLASGDFTDKSVGSGKTVNISGLALAGEDAGNYVLSTVTTTADITPKELTVTGIIALDKVYDGNITAGLDVSGAVLEGVIEPDEVLLDTSGAVGDFSDSSPGTGKAVAINGLTISGADSGNYTLVQPTATASILAPNIQVEGKSTVILNGDSTPSATDGTDFGNVVNLSMVKHSFTITNTGDSDLHFSGDPAVAISGETPLIFTLAADATSPVAPGESVTFRIAFQPTRDGSYTALITIASDDPDEPSFTFLVKGRGYTPETPVGTPTPTTEGRVIAEVNAGQMTATDNQGNSLAVTGSLITITEDQGTIRVNIPVEMDEGEGLGSLTGTEGLKFENNTLEIPASAITGSLLEVYGDNGEMDTTLIIQTGDFTGNGGQASAEIKSIQVTTGSTGRDLSEENPAVGEVSSSISLDLATLPQNAGINITTTATPDSDASSAFQLAAMEAGADSIDIAYTINIEKTNLENGKDIQEATITMAVSPEWVEANGGTENVRIIRYDPETGTSQVLETQFVGYDENGRAVFQAVSPDGLSVFGLTALNKEPEVDPETPAPPTTTPPATSPAATQPPATTQAPVTSTPVTEPVSLNLGLVIGLLVAAAVIALIAVLVVRSRKQEK